MFALSLVGDPHPLDEAALDGIAHLSKEYVDLMKKWGPGRAKAHLDSPTRAARRSQTSSSASACTPHIRRRWAAGSRSMPTHSRPAS